MAARTVGGAQGVFAIMSFLSANALTWAVGDKVVLDTGANWTVKKPVDNTVPLGEVVSIEGPATSTSATSTILGIKLYRYNKCIRVATNASIALGTSIQSNGTGNNIETNGVDGEGAAGGNNNWYGNVVVAIEGSGSAYTADVLCV